MLIFQNLGQWSLILPFILPYLENDFDSSLQNETCCNLFKLSLSSSELESEFGTLKTAIDWKEGIWCMVTVGVGNQHTLWISLPLGFLNLVTCDLEKIYLNIFPLMFSTKDVAKKAIVLLFIDRYCSQRTCIQYSKW